jgi:predicted DsbA family dithiol-disulfide isomerase
MMTVEIWSDVVCPFCYIGKREFEKALARFPDRDQVNVVWKSFELDPDAPARSEYDMYGMLVSKYGGTREDAKARVDGVVQRARTVGLDYQMDKAVIGSSFDAHRLLQYAKTKGLGGAMKERLFKAYFTEGAHLADVPTLVRLGSEVGLDGAEVAEMLSTAAYTDAVRADEREGQLIGVRGVPFFVIDRKFSVSGAQQSDAFLGALQQAWEARK